SVLKCDNAEYYTSTCDKVGEHLEVEVVPPGFLEFEDQNLRRYMRMCQIGKPRDECRVKDLKDSVSCDEGGFVTFGQLIKHRKMNDFMMEFRQGSRSQPGRPVRQEEVAALALLCVELCALDQRDVGTSRFVILGSRVTAATLKVAKEKCGEQQTEELMRKNLGWVKPISISAAYGHKPLWHFNPTRHIYAVEPAFADFAKGAYFDIMPNALENHIAFGIPPAIGNPFNRLRFTVMPPWDERVKEQGDKFPGEMGVFSDLVNFGAGIGTTGGIYVPMNEDEEPSTAEFIICDAGQQAQAPLISEKLKKMKERELHKDEENKLKEEMKEELEEQLKQVDQAVEQRPGWMSKEVSVCSHTPTEAA
ncbi:unnamed protein product, partial [Effrenium voratum]